MLSVEVVSTPTNSPGLHMRRPIGLLGFLAREEGWLLVNPHL